MEFTELVEEAGSLPKIKVIGVGGGGGNAINHMINSRMTGAQFIAANTEMRVLNKSLAEYKVQLGPKLTKGLGAGGDPQIGLAAAQESKSMIQDMLGDADMLFIAAGMGGGTGTGAAPLVAQFAREMGILTVGVVTKPFSFERHRRMASAEAGVEELRKHADNLIVIPNDRLVLLAPKNATFLERYNAANDVLYHSVRGIVELLTKSGYVDLDFNDVRTAMSKPGRALMGVGAASGENRAREAAQQAINSPLLEDANIDGAQAILFNITSDQSLTMEELSEAADIITKAADQNADVFYGHVLLEEENDEVSITVIATGIDSDMTPPVEIPGYSRNGLPPARRSQPAPAENWVSLRAQAQNPRPAGLIAPGNLEQSALQRRAEQEWGLTANAAPSEKKNGHVPGMKAYSFSEEDAGDIPCFIRKQAN
ncbi:MAG: cell division protein FtsZ [Deltaproteobacteria bacterium]|jgi:cell division protein FtsZ|nr:cell division protein FtsZ [Deltaproteobacteria bacterium]